MIEVTQGDQSREAAINTAAVEEKNVRTRGRTDLPSIKYGCY